MDSIQFLIGDVLGVLVDQCLNWSQQVSYVRSKSLVALAIAQRVSYYMSTKVFILLYNAFVLPHLTCCCVVWHFAPKLYLITCREFRTMLCILF